MPTFVYRPNDPRSDENGFILKEEAMLDDYIRKDHLHMRDGNRKVSFYFNSDTMEPTQHMASGKMFTSKAKFRAETKAHGCIEVGNEMPKPRKPIKLSKRQRREDIKRAVYELRNGRRV